MIVGGRCFDFLTTAPNHYERFFGGIEPEGKTGVLYGAEGKETNRQRRADQEADPAENPHQKLDLSCRSCARSSRQIRRCWAGHDEFIPLRPILADNRRSCGTELPEIYLFQHEKLRVSSKLFSRLEFPAGWIRKRDASGAEFGVSDAQSS